MMRLPFLLEPIGAILIFIFLFMQVIVPLWRGVPMFPMLSKARRKLGKRLVKINEKGDVNKLERELRSAERRSRR